MIAPPVAAKYSAFFAWWSPVANGYGTRIAGRPAAAISQTEPPERASDEVAARDGGAEAVRLGDQPVVGALDAALQRRVVARARDVEHRRADLRRTPRRRAR